METKISFWYLTFDGDQDNIKKAFFEDYGLANTKHFDEVLKDVNLDNYIILLEKDFKRFSNTAKDLVIKKDFPKY